MDMLKRSRFDRLIEKATSELLIEPDIETTLAICDLIRGQELTAKNAVTSIKRRLQNDNPNVVLHTLYVLESMMKNCGTPVHEEVATADFMSTLTSLTGKSYDVCEQVLGCIQNWAFVFKGKPGYSAIQDAYEELKSEGHTFPAFSENDAMFSVVCAPNWKEEDICHRCKVPFTTFRRRHHCRNCGNSFCAECSSERAMLPKFGIEKEVRVCDHCFDSLSRGTNQDKQAKEKKVSTAKEEEARREKERQDLELQAREQEELQLALALSASEAECKEKERRGYSQSTRPAADSSRQAENGPLHLLPVLDTSEMDPELARYLNRNYWENRANALNQNAVGGKSTQDGHPSPPMPQPSAPIYASPVPPPAPIQMPAARTFSNSVKAGTMDTANHGATEDGNIRNNTAGVCLPGVPELTTQKQEEFLNALRASIEFFVNRMQSNNQRGRSIANDTTVQALFLTLHEMHPQLLQQKQAMEERRAYFEGLQDKLSQLREAREALDALRLDHAARRQMEEQEAARLRQLQMMQKLEIMRQQKRTTLEYKRRMALEQTMQYQQKYQLQHQPNMQSVDPVTGLPLTLPMTTYQSPNYPVAYPPPNIRPTEAGYAPGQMMANYGPSPDLSSPYGQPPISEDPAYYQPQLQQQQPPPAQPPQTIPGAQTTSGMYYNAQSMGQQAPIPGSYATSSAGPYSMQRLEASLPPTGTQSEIVGAYQMSDNPQLYSTSEAAAKPMETYSGQPNQPTVEIHPSSTGLPTQIAPAYPQQQPPQQASPILKQQPQQQEQQAQSRHQPQSTTEGQLISFD